MPGPGWLLLVHALPPKPLYLRAKIRGRLAKVGALALKNSVYVLPRTDDALEDFQWIAEEARAGGGQAFVAEADFLSGIDVRELIKRFRKEAEEMLRKRKSQPGKRGARTVRRPDLTGRVWVTRRGVKIDRIASAWLVRRFLDPKARFRFVDPQKDAPRAGELRFDMVGGDFTHEGDRCTFESLIARAGVADPALAPIAEIVHDVDLKDGKFGRPDAAGIKQLLEGLIAATSRRRGAPRAGFRPLRRPPRVVSRERPPEIPREDGEEVRRGLLVSNSTLHGRGYLDHAEREIQETLEGVRTVLFVPYALQDRDAYAAKARARSSPWVSRSTSLHEAPDPAKAVRKADAFFIGGGNTFRLLNELYTGTLLADPGARGGGHSLHRLERGLERRRPDDQDDEGHAHRPAALLRLARPGRSRSVRTTRTPTRLDAHGRDAGRADPAVPRGERAPVAGLREAAFCEWRTPSFSSARPVPGSSDGARRRSRRCRSRHLVSPQPVSAGADALTLVRRDVALLSIWTTASKPSRTRSGSTEAGRDAARRAGLPGGRRISRQGRDPGRVFRA